LEETIKMSIPYFGCASDFPFVPSGITGDVQVFSPVDSGGQSKPQQWVKPRGITMVCFFLVDAGGGGGGGLTGATTTARGGGAGGACGSIAIMIMPAFLLPDVLKVWPGNPGLGGSGSGVGGGSAGRSIILTGIGVASTQIPNTILVASSLSAGGGAAGTNTGAATGGSVPTVAAKGTTGWAGSVSIQVFTVGLVGAAGGNASGAAGSNITAGWNTIPLTPGSGGGGVTGAGTGFAGGTIALQAAMDCADISFPSAIVSGGAAGGAGAAGPGNAGITCFKPFVMTGGTGGGSSDGAAGGAGGNGGIGCGGGGGGGGTTGGRGGDGGPGMIAIAAW
jgi:hypothetical protein